MSRLNFWPHFYRVFEEFTPENLPKWGVSFHVSLYYMLRRVLKSFLHGARLPDTLSRKAVFACLLIYNEICKSRLPPTWTWALHGGWKNKICGFLSLDTSKHTQVCWVLKLSQNRPHLAPHSVAPRLVSRLSANRRIPAICTLRKEIGGETRGEQGAAFTMPKSSPK